MTVDTSTLLSWLIDHAGCKAKQVADFVGVEQSTITRWRCCECKPNPDNEASIEDFYHRVQAYCACRAPAVLPAECFNFICSHAEQRPPDHAINAQRLLAPALARICPDYKKLSLDPPAVASHATPWAVVGIPIDLRGTAYAHVFRAVCGQSAAFAVLFDERLRGETLRNTLSTEFGHVLDHVVDRGLPSMAMPINFMDVVGRHPIHEASEKGTCRNCHTVLQSSWAYCPSCGENTWNS